MPNINRLIEKLSSCVPCCGDAESDDERPSQLQIGNPILTFSSNNELAMVLAGTMTASPAEATAQDRNTESLATARVSMPSSSAHQSRARTIKLVPQQPRNEQESPTPSEKAAASVNAAVSQK